MLKSAVGRIDQENCTAAAGGIGGGLLAQALACRGLIAAPAAEVARLRGLVV